MMNPNEMKMFKKKSDLKALSFSILAQKLNFNTLGWYSLLFNL